jgi:membrane protein implicated in regulation of membrane protease activity
MSMMLGDGAAAGGGGLSSFLTALIAFVMGLLLALLAVFTLTKVVEPNTQQSDTSLIVYGESGS